MSSSSSSKNDNQSPIKPLPTNNLPASSYYDIDALLAEEELVPCTTLFDFAHLSHLDADRRHNYSHLPEGSQIKLPLWATEKWAMLGFCRIQLPRHFQRRARERYEADPADADLRKRNERFFLAGHSLVQLIRSSSTHIAKQLVQQKAGRRRNAATQALEQANQEAIELQRTLLKSFGGERLRQTLNWALSSGGDDDVSQYTSKLSQMELRLFEQGTSAVSALEQWRLYGNRLLVVGSNTKPKAQNNNNHNSNNNMATGTPGPQQQGRPVTPPTAGGEPHNARQAKRQRV